MSLDPLTAGLDLAKLAVEKLWPDKSEAEKQQLAAAVLLTQGQLEVNRAEASSSSPFTSGWRPFIGWTCGAGFAVQFVIGPLGSWISGLVGHQLDVPRLDFGEMMPVLLGMLGLGTLRTYEKVKGVARDPGP